LKPNRELKPRNRELSGGPEKPANGYWSDFNRTATVGAASPKQRDAYKLVREHTYEMLDKIRAGVSVAEAAEANTLAPNRRGIDLPENIPGRIGRGSGMDMTEPPSVAPFDDTVLEAGTVVPIEPKMIHDYGPLRLEQVVAVSDNGCEFLSTNHANSPAEVDAFPAATEEIGRMASEERAKVTAGARGAGVGEG
jgi:Xaa-Pro aminopeptidase